MCIFYLLQSLSIIIDFSPQAKAFGPQFMQKESLISVFVLLKSPFNLPKNEKENYLFWLYFTDTALDNTLQKQFLKTKICICLCGGVGWKKTECVRWCLTNDSRWLDIVRPSLQANNSEKDYPKLFRGRLFDDQISDRKRWKKKEQERELLVLVLRERR